MIKFTLKCADGHQFDSWFQSAQAYDKLNDAGMVACAICGSDDVHKAMMAPSVRAAGSADTAPQPDRANAQGTGAKGTGALSTPASPAEQALRKLRRDIEANSEYVGRNFAREARDIHDGTAPERAIYGEAKPEDAKKLIDDGIAVTALPFRTRRKEN